MDRMSGIRAFGIVIVIGFVLRFGLVVGPGLVRGATERPLIPILSAMAGFAGLAVLQWRRRTRSIAERQQRFAAANEAAISEFKSDAATGWAEQMQARQAASSEPTERTWGPPPAPPVNN